jgi:hypothetical protein
MLETLGGTDLLRVSRTQNMFHSMPKLRDGSKL